MLNPVQDKYQRVASIAHDLGVRCQHEYSEAKSYRVDIEQRWLSDLRQYKGLYEPDIATRMNPRMCKAFVRLTRTKVKTMDARMLDLLFPSNNEKNWGIAPTPYPEINPAELQKMQLAVTQHTGQQPSPDGMDKIIKAKAKDACDKMSKEIEDQLAEIHYRNLVKEVIHSGNLYGTGVLKGPLVEERTIERWIDNQGQGYWEFDQQAVLRPYAEVPSIWNLYPDMTVTDIGAARYLYQRYCMSPREVAELGDRPLFDKTSITEYLRAYPEGDYELESVENELLGLSDNYSVLPKKTRKYEVVERWGTFLGKDLVEVGIDIPEDQLHLEFESNIWLLGPIVIKAVLAPIKGIRWPYYFYYFDKDESCIFGEGIPAIMRDAQQLHNSSVRAMFDNAGLSTGNIWEVNIDLVPANFDPYTIYANMVIPRHMGDSELTAQYPAVRAYSVPSHTPEFLQLCDLTKTIADETTTIPRYLQGADGGTGGAGETARGLSMLMGAVNITLKDQIKSYDDDVTTPFISALYHWNMQFGERHDIKGDFDVQAKGFSSLMAKEVLIEQLTQFSTMTNNPGDLRYVKRGDLLRMLARQTAFGEEIIRTDKEVQEEEMRQVMIQRQAELQAVLSEAQKRGINPDVVIAKALENIAIAQYQQSQVAQQQRGVPM